MSTRPNETFHQLESALKIARFVEYSSAFPLDHVCVASRWHLKVFDCDGKMKYFVNAHLYRRIEDHLLDSVVFQATLYPKQQGKEWITVQLHNSSVSSALRFFDNAYTSLDCELDRHNN
jgi:hypothetical protein